MLTFRGLFWAVFWGKGGFTQTDRALPVGDSKAHACALQWWCFRARLHFIDLWSFGSSSSLITTLFSVLLLSFFLSAWCNACSLSSSACFFYSLFSWLFLSRVARLFSRPRANCFRSFFFSLCPLVVFCVYFFGLRFNKRLRRHYTFKTATPGLFNCM